MCVEKKTPDKKRFKGKALCVSENLSDFHKIVNLRFAERMCLMNFFAPQNNRARITHCVVKLSRSCFVSDRHAAR